MPDNDRYVMNRGEQMAKETLERVLGVPLEPRDVRTHEGLHDFDILFSDGVAPLEVKTATDQNLRRLFAGFEKVGDELPAAGRGTGMSSCMRRAISVVW